MEKMKKITKKEVYGEMLRIFTDMERQDLVEFVEHEIELIEKKASRNVTTQTQKENIELVEMIYNELKRIGTPVTITDLQKQSEKVGEYSNQKISALMKKLVDSERVIKTIEKKKSYFSIAE